MMSVTKKTKNPVIQMMQECSLLRPIYLIFACIWILKCGLDILQKIVLGTSIDYREAGINGILPFLIICITCTLCSYLFTIFNKYMLNKCIEKHIKEIRVKAGYHLINVPYMKIESMQRGDILSRTMGDLEKIQVFLEQNISEFAITTISGVIGLIISFYTSWILTLAIILTIPVIMVINIITTRSMERLIMNQKGETGRGNGIALNVLSQLSSVKAFCLEQPLSKKYFEQLKKIRSAEIKIARKQAALSFVQCLGGSIIYITLMVVGGVLVIGDELSAGNFVVILMLIEPIGAFAYHIQRFIYTYKECKTGSIRILDILKLPEEYDNEKYLLKKDRKKEKKKGSVDSIHQKKENSTTNMNKDDVLLQSSGKKFINFSNVSFAYHYLKEMDQKTHTVLENVSFSISKGQRVAIVGSSGCGKSTLVKLICALYQVSGGNIEVDGIALTEENVEKIRNKIAVVLQENYLFPMTIEENIRCGNPDASEEDVIEAAKKVGIHDFIQSLPGGYKTMLGEDGKSLSGGQRQRICICRAYIKKPDILVLDEPTAALDMESERIVEESLEQLMEGKTTITIAHRLSTIKNSDVILCMDNGKIVETGTHSELYAKRGRYYCLYRIQEEMAEGA